jgi:pimeloyl-ACP methyl ester carboxylesterase
MLQARVGLMWIGVVVAGSLVVACGGDDSDDAGTTSTEAPGTTTTASEGIDRVVDIGGRGLYVRCTGSGSPTVVLEGGDEDTSTSYGFAEDALAEVTTTCVYDRANLGQSDPAPGPRGLVELVGDLESLIDAADIPGPYVLVGTSGGGYIVTGYAVAHPDEVAGMVLVDTAAPLADPPPELIEETAWDNPANVEHRDYLQVERDAWAARRQIGDIPVTIITVDYGARAELDAERSNVEDQQGWLVLSPRAEQVVVTTSHSVEEDDPDLVLGAILDVVRAAR